ncbi:MAG: DUF1194 domain-containing protein, partial [Hyphomicrobiaceae bacterium]
LAILTDFTELGEWYRQHVIVGPGSFVVEAHGFEDFKRAMREKLFREFVTVVSQNEQLDDATAQLALR